MSEIDEICQELFDLRARTKELGEMNIWLPEDECFQPVREYIVTRMDQFDRRADEHGDRLKEMLGELP